MLRELTWFENPSPSSENEVKKLETELGIIFPADYREFLKEFGGGSPEETDFTLSEKEGMLHASVGIFLTAGTDDYSISNVLALVENRYINDLIPIAESGGGDYLCLDYRNDYPPKLVYWVHGRYSLDNEVVNVSETFSDFLEMLKVPNDDEY